MKKDAKEITQEIMVLVNELAKMAGVKTTTTKVVEHGSKKENSGATGGLRMLVDEGYFNTPQVLPSIMERLKQEGRHYSNATVSMGLLSLVRERVLTRFRDKKEKKWSYVIRK